MSEIKGQVSEQYINLATRSQVMIERLKAGQVKQFRPFLERIERQLRMRLAAGDVTGYQAARISRLLDSIESDLKGIFSEYRTALTGDLVDIAIQQAKDEADILSAIATDPAFEPVIPSPQQVRTAVLSAPLAVKGYNAGKLLEPWLEGWTDGQIEQISGVIRQGYYQGQTTDQIVRALRGTTGKRFQDGTLAQIDRGNTTLVRTAVQHCAEVARDTFYKANDDIIEGVEWVSTLDSRTTTQCRTLDGTRWPLDKGPRPPLHPACRSRTCPVLGSGFEILDKGATRSSKGDAGGKQVDAGLSYYEWLKTQPASFQDIAIGPKRGKLLRDGGLSAERFAELQLGTNFEPLTLNEMRELAPTAFARAGL